MILVTLGTQDKKFTRLLDAIQKEIDNGTINEEVVVQAGYTKFKSKNMKIFDLIPMEEFDDLIKSCDILITHGGVGSIIAGLKQNKKIIAVPRLKEYGEHTNNHQEQIVNNFDNDGYILGVKKIDDLNRLLKKVKTFKPKEYTSNTQNMIKIVTNYIDNTNYKFNIIPILILIVILLIIII